MKKVLLISVDGMRPDGLQSCNSPYLSELLENSLHDLAAQTVMPSVTLPCHMTMFHGVTPQRHGILTNTYVPQVRPVNGICEALKAAKKKAALFYSWAELGDLARPGSYIASVLYAGWNKGYDVANQRVTAACKQCIAEDAPDFVFAYYGFPDAAGHGNGWMSQPYLDSIAQSLSCIHDLLQDLPEDYLTIITADHGGHDRAHGTDMPEDMTIPVLLLGKDITPGIFSGASIIDIPKTVASVIGIEPEEEWEGKVLPFKP